MDKQFFRLGEISDFVFTMLGDFCSASGFDAKKQKDYKEEKTSTAFDKYNLIDNKSEISKLINSFYETAFEKHKCFSYFSFYMINFSNSLQSAISKFNCSILIDFSKKEILQFLIIHYTAFHYAKFSILEYKNFKDSLNFHAKKKYSDILKNHNLTFTELSEKASWTSLEKVLQEYKKYCSDNNEKDFNCKDFIQHYLFLGFTKALKNVFDFSEEEINNTIDFIIKNIDEVEYNCKNLFTPAENMEEIIFYLLNPYPQNEEIPYLYVFFQKENYYLQKSFKLFQERNFSNLAIEYQASDYFINSYSQINQEKAEEYFKLLNALNDDYTNKILIPWYKARTLIFSLTFCDKEHDEKLKQEACNIYKEIFSNYKYFIGNNLPEFLSDAIAIDVYCNPKKDIFNNAQDNTDESSILKPGKSYWDFGYAIGLFAENSKKTYLLSYNAEQNFWTNFPPTKFLNFEQAYNVFCKETKENEFELPALLNEKYNNQKEKDKLIREDKKNLRTPLGLRYYSQLSIRCMIVDGSNFGELDKIADFGRINKYIIENSENADLLFTNDENGANALIRSLERYKMLSYGFSDENQTKRNKIFSEYYNNITQKQYEIIKNIFPNALYEDEELIKTLDEFSKKEFDDFVSKMDKFYKKIKPKPENFGELKSELKNKIILPLIKCVKNHIFDEAIRLNGRKCISALQLAIDCYDFEIVTEILNNLPEGTELSKTYISHEYLTPLQYAIRKYDYLMQFIEMIYRKKNWEISKRDTIRRKNIEKGVLDSDKNYYQNGDIIFKFINTNPIEECGFYLTPKKNENPNIIFEQQENLIKIIELLAQKSNPISVDTFYYLADQVDPIDNSVFNDVLDITRILIETGHAELTGTNFEWDREDSICENQTLLAYCINHSSKNPNCEKIFQKNYGMLDFLLSEYPEKFKDSINNKIMAYGDNGKIRYDTDLHYFITNQIESIKLYQNMKRDLGYGKQIAFTMNRFLTLFYNAGADFNTPDHDGKTALDYLRQYRTYMPTGCIPQEIVKML